MFENRRVIARFAVLAVALFGLRLSVFADDEGSSAGVRVATGQRVTPGAAPGSQVLRLHTDLRSDENADAANAVTTALSPNGNTLLILTSGSNNSFFKEDGTPIVYDLLDPTTGQVTGKTTSSAEWVLRQRCRGEGRVSLNPLIEKRVDVRRRT